MDNSPNNAKNTNILTELSGGVSELGEAFALVLNDMVVQSGITNPKAEPFQVVPNSWRKLAEKPDKTPEDIEFLDKTLYDEIYTLSQSYLLFIAKEVKNKTGKINYDEYETFMMKYRFGHYTQMNYSKYMDEVKAQLKIAFDKISAGGRDESDGLIDKFDMAVFIYVLLTKSDRGENDQFKGFKINGIITPFDYAVSEKLLFEDKNNLLNIKFKVAYEVLKDIWRE